MEETYQRSRWARAGAVTSSLAAILVFSSVHVWEATRDVAPHLLALVGVTGAAAWGGLWPGLAVTAAAAAMCTWTLTASGELIHEGAGSSIRLVLFVALGIFVSVSLDAKHRARRRELAMRAREAQVHRELERVSRARDEFIAVVSHELRTPLGAILGWASLLRTGGVSDVVRAATVIERNAKAQSKLVEDLLDMSRIRTSGIALKVERLDLEAIVSEAVEAAQPQAQARRITLTHHGQALRGFVCGDATRLLQVVGNLLTNAIKFSEMGGAVATLVRLTDRHVVLEVRDTGVGISSEFLPHVFDAFGQEESGPSRRVGGLGLGLSIARHLVQLHGGEIVAASEGRGRGATFTVSLPLAGVEPAPVSDGLGVSIPSSTGPLDGLRALVVDDDADGRDLAATILGGAGAMVCVEATADAALARLRSESFDVIVSDIAMPGHDGMWLASELRARGAPPSVPLLALTALAAPSDRSNALASGFDDVLVKPVDARDLVRRVRARCAREEAARRSSSIPQ